jgi:site-specific DNA-methyltransferase (adenine-specific)
MGKYGVILADPPWAYHNWSERKQGAAAAEYPTMSVAQLKALPVESLAADNSVLLLWGTWPKLAEACLPVMEAWGFRYITGFPWVKITEIGSSLWGGVEISVQYGVGFWARGCTELVLIGKRGNAKPPESGFIGLLSPNLYHSRKPDDLYEYAEAMPGPYLELFARRSREGWDVWGNEVGSTIDLGL